MKRKPREKHYLYIVLRNRQLYFEWLGEDYICYSLKEAEGKIPANALYYGIKKVYIKGLRVRMSRKTK